MVIHYFYQLFYQDYLFDVSDYTIVTISNSFLESLTSKEMAETKTGSLLTSSDKREISALITFKGGLVCSFGNGKVIVLQVQTSKDDDDIRFKVADIIKLPIRNPTTAGNFSIFLLLKHGIKIKDLIL